MGRPGGRKPGLLGPRLMLSLAYLWHLPGTDFFLNRIPPSTTLLVLLVPSQNRLTFFLWVSDPES